MAVQTPSPDAVDSERTSKAANKYSLATVLDGGGQQSEIRRHAHIEAYRVVDKKIDRCAVIIVATSVLYVVLTVVLCETSWDEGTSSFEQESVTVMALQGSLLGVSLVLAFLVYWRAILDTVNKTPGLEIRLSTVPPFDWKLITELLWNLLTSYSGTSPLLALPGGHRLHSMYRIYSGTVRSRN